MYYKIARSSVKKSFRDYTIYFLTLTFAVCIFYSFNSLEAQQSVLDMSQSSSDYLSKIAAVIAIISVGVSFILGGLIIYANHFLIKRRKKELGIYMTLGMRRTKISTILIVETFLIGCISLGAGLILGILVSQGASELIAKVFDASMSRYQFIISYSAIAETCLYFGVIFLSVILFNHVIVSRVKLIDLLNAAKKNEVLKVKSAAVSVLVFLIAAGLLAYAYRTVIRTGFDPYNPGFLISILLGVLGTLLVFFSLAGFFMHVLQRSRRFYLNKLNIFVLRQIHNKVNTNFISMAVISLMLFVTLLTLFVAFSYKANQDKVSKGLAPFAASLFTTYVGRDEVMPDIREALDQVGFQFQDSEQHAYFNIYSLGVKSRELLNGYWDESSSADKSLMNDGIAAVSLSDYNSIRMLKGLAPADLQDNEALIVSNYGNTSSSLKRFMKNEASIAVGQEALRIKNKEAIPENLMNTPYQSSFFYLIVPDRFVSGLTLASRALDIEPRGGSAAAFEAKFSTLFDRSFEAFQPVNGFTSGQSKMIINGLSIFLIFLGLYIGLVFLISSAVVLALQQLVEANESVERYRILKKIGATDGMIHQTIFRQTLVYFLLPIAMALIHTAVGIKVMNSFFEAHEQSALGSSAGTLILMFVIVYGGYFYTTYSGYKSIVKNR